MTRRHFDGTKLENDIAHLRALDATSPPVARPSLMDAVRAFAEFIDTRAKLGWTDAMIASVLTEAGYPINAATLRSYRKRMRDESSISSTSNHTTSPIVLDSAEKRSDRNWPADPVKAATVTSEPAKTTDTSTLSPSGVGNVTPAARPPPDRSSPSRRTFSVDPTKRPPDHA